MAAADSVWARERKINTKTNTKTNSNTKTCPAVMPPLSMSRWCAE
ncbi:MAG: hypothetical protein WA418_28055 [Bradyrhizobium sp.]